ncbi:MAG TPA: universal stress protein [Gaiellaceae bacterium]|nr:universal stress protein [Gaiellaceae bacterium]
MPRARSIVVGFDGSEQALRALEAAAGLVGYGSQLTVVAVGYNGGPEPAAALASARDLLLRRQILATYLMRLGDPADELVHAAEELHADLVVVGTRGEEALRSELGSVSRKVVGRAPCDVLVVR